MFKSRGNKSNTKGSVTYNYYYVGFSTLQCWLFKG
jgi:hypothetical protein